VGGATSMHYVHALDYLMYAYLQQGQDAKAREVLDNVNAVDNYQAMGGAAYGIAAAQARYPLERRQWAEAAALAVRPHRAFPWDNFPWFEALTYFARGLGAARIGDAAAARSAIETLDAFYAQTVQAEQAYWAVQVDAQRKTVAAWLAFAEGQRDEALSSMRAAADLEDSVDKHPVTPGAVLPARELLGDMLLLLDRPEEALAAYEMSLTISPNRYHSLSGAGRAAELAGDKGKATSYYRMLVEMTAKADAARETARRD
jgi:tetratricopeptide (TPR) repeat protein